MAESITVEQTSDAVLDAARPQQKNDLADLLRRLAEKSGRSLTSVIGDYARTAFGPGKLSFDEYLSLGLYDTARYAGADLKSFVGLKAMREIWWTANFRLEFFDVIRNKVTATALLEAHGFPVIPISAVFCTTTGYESAKCLNSVASLRRYLTDPAHYPLFGKPENGFQSLGSASFQSYDVGRGVLVGWDGRTLPLDRLVDDITGHYSQGYLFQPRLSPHADTKAICGDRLATVRVVTVSRDGGPGVLRVSEKIPGGANIADNFWRAGNLVVQVDPSTGRRGRVISGTGFEHREHTHHPDTDAAITGTVIPNWETVRDLALEGARLFKESALIGWDIAPVDGGAVIVDVNVTPDLMLPQLTDAKGILDDDFRAFLKERRQAAKHWVKHVRKTDTDSYRPSYKN
jgi:hypothetical protein